MSEMKWPYPAKVSQVNRMEADVIVLGGGPGGYVAAIKSPAAWPPSTPPSAARA